MITKSNIRKGKMKIIKQYIQELEVDKRELNQEILWTRGYLFETV